MSTQENARSVGLTLESLDVLFFRDGRPFGAATRAVSGQPMPQTVAGAIWTALLEKYGCRFADLAKEIRKLPRTPAVKQIAEAIGAAGGEPWIADVRIRGPWLASLNENREVSDVLIPTPAVLYRVKGNETLPLERLRPRPHGALPGWRPPESRLHPLWLKSADDTEPVGGYLGQAALREFLADGVPDRSEAVASDRLFGWDYRTGIEIAPDSLTAKKGGIYGTRLLALRGAYTAPEERGAARTLPTTVLYVKVILPGGAPQDVFSDIATLTLGGEGKRVAARPMADGESFKWQGVEPSESMHKPLLLLTTPGLFNAGWKPKCLDGRIAAAAVPGYLAVSGWDLARSGPKPTRFAVPAGSVYFLNGPADDLHEALADDEADRRQGWGCFVKGVWNDGRSHNR